MAVAVLVWVACAVRCGIGACVSVSVCVCGVRCSVLNERRDVSVAGSIPTPGVGRWVLGKSVLIFVSAVLCLSKIGALVGF